MANTVLLFTGQGAMMVGFTLGGPLEKYLGVDVPYWTASLLLFTSAMVIAGLPPDKAKRKQKLSQAGSDKGEKEEVTK